MVNRCQDSYETLLSTTSETIETFTKTIETISNLQITNVVDDELIYSTNTQVTDNLIKLVLASNPYG